MNDKDILISHALDMKEKCADNSVITHTNFMSLEELSTVKVAEKQFSEYTDTYYYGGYDDAERCIALFVPKFYSVTDIEEYLKAEVLPYNPDAWIDKSKTKVGYEIPFTRTFYVYKELEKADDIAKRIEAHEQSLIAKLHALFDEEK